MKILLLAEIDVAKDHEAAQVILDNFRESVLPSANYGITLSMATPEDVKELTAPAKPLSLAEIRRRLHVGIEFTAEFVGINARLCKPGMQRTRRRVVKNSRHEIESVMLDGPRKGEPIHLNWKHTSASERDGAIILTMTEVEPREEFLKITR